MDFHDALAAASTDKSPANTEARLPVLQQAHIAKSQTVEPKRKNITPKSSIADNTLPSVLSSRGESQTLPAAVSAQISANFDTTSKTSEQVQDLSLRGLQVVFAKEAPVGDQKTALPSAEALHPLGSPSTRLAASEGSALPNKASTTGSSAAAEAIPNPLVGPTSGTPNLASAALTASVGQAIGTSILPDVVPNAAVGPTLGTPLPASQASNAFGVPTNVSSTAENTAFDTSTVSTTCTSGPEDAAPNTPAVPPTITAALGGAPSNPPRVAPTTQDGRNAPSKTSVVAQAADSSKVFDASGLLPIVDTSDSATRAVDQAAAAIAQSVVAVPTLPSFSATSAIETVSEVVTGKTATTSSEAGVLNQISPRQAAPAPSKAKTVSPASEVRSKGASDRADDSPAANVSAADTVSPRIPETPAAINHPVPESHGAFNPSDLQAISQTPQIDGSNNQAQSKLSAATSTAGSEKAAPTYAPPDSLAMPSITSAQLTQSMRSSEMKLGMQSTEFGNISISTSLNHQAISAQISIDHTELGRALAIHLPAIEEKLGSAYGVQAKVELRESSTPSSSNESGYSNSGQQSREQRKSEYGGSPVAQGAMFSQSSSRTSSSGTPLTASGLRLDIRI